MRAIDTNIVVRYLINDDATQAAQAKAVVKAGDLFVSATVLLETEWVLRSVYGLPANEIAAALRAFVGQPTVAVESPRLFADALDFVDRGLDFADALHLGAATHCDTFLTFDRDFIKLAPEGPVRVTAP